MNAYATVPQFFQQFDRRLLTEVSSDDGSTVGAQGTDPNAFLQAALDTQASVLDSYLQGRFGNAPLTLNPIPMVLTRWVCVKSAEMMLGRRFSAPKGLEKLVEWADKWLELLLEGKVTIPGASRVAPALQDSDFKDGRSRFDRVWGQRPSTTGPSGGR